MYLDCLKVISPEIHINYKVGKPSRHRFNQVMEITSATVR